VLPPHVQEWLKLSLDRKPVSLAESIGLDVPDQPLKLKLSIISQIGSDEILLRLIEGDPNDDQALLRNKLNLTQREAEVLLWIARGKSNRDIADILKLSPRTVNKHLEQIFNKIGVENRASAAALAVRALGAR
jgi:DNA-binding CsgD family transcriptional regulator